MSKNGNGEQEVMTAKDVSEFLRIPLSTVYGLAKRGQIKGVKVGKHWRYLKSDISDFLQGVHTSPNPSIVPMRRERRAYSRINCEIPAAILVALTRRGGQETTGVIQNLCEGGMFFLDGNMEHGLRVGDPVFVIFDVPVLASRNGGNGGYRKMRAEGRIVRVSKNGAYTMAVKFRPMNSEDREAIQSYVG